MASLTGKTVPEEPNMARPKIDSSSNGYHAPDTSLFRLLPSSCVPYAELMRLDRPAGYYAFYWHYAIGLAFAACTTSPPVEPQALVMMAAYLALWVVVLRGAVCSWNDNLDQEFDRKVARTRFRPIARGAVSTLQAHIFTLIQIVVMSIMLVPLSHAAVPYVAVMVLILIVYPLGKRVTDFPQVILGFGFATPIFICSALFGVDLLQQNKLNRSNFLAMRYGAICLYMASVLWTVIYDTIYAHQDIKDDIKAGVRSLAVRLGHRTKLGLGILGAVQVSLLIATGYFCRLSIAYYAISCGGTALSLTAMLTIVDLQVPASCAWWFGPGSRLIGMSVLVGLLSHYTVQNWLS